MKKLIKKHGQKIRFLLTGILNTIIGYGIFVGLYFTLSAHIHYMLIMMISNIFSISFAFISYKYLVFRTKGHILHEYLRFYVVYAFSIGINIVLLPFMVEVLYIHPVVAQGLTIFITVIFSYIGHKNYSFKQIGKVVS